jgi:hypothetical protein
MLEGDVCLRCGEPSVLGFQVVHGLVEIVEVLVAKVLVVEDVPLTTGVMERVVVTFSGEVQPLYKIISAGIIQSKTARKYLRVTELVAFEVQVAFATQRVGQQSVQPSLKHQSVRKGEYLPDHLMQSNSS